MQRLILMTSDDYNSFLLKVVENLVDHEKFKVENYDKSVNKQRSKPEKKVKRKHDKRHEAIEAAKAGRTYY